MVLTHKEFKTAYIATHYAWVGRRLDPAVENLGRGVAEVVARDLELLERVQPPDGDGQRKHLVVVEVQHLGRQNKRVSKTKRVRTTLGTRVFDTDQRADLSSSLHLTPPCDVST